MSNLTNFFPIPTHKHHGMAGPDHEVDYIESLPAQDAHPDSSEQNHKNIMSQLRKEYFAQDENTDKRNLSTKNSPKIF